ncbi:MAG: hypothetical protein KF805_13750 [Phycisphaeraceae bacterium]|nr:hypothetical protein [Phycisphaeraceae bacterium]
MNRKMRLCGMAACAGSVFAVACADELSTLSSPTVPFKTLNDAPPWRDHAAAGSPFGDRSINVIVYDNVSSIFTSNNLSIGQCSHLLEDISFNPGPYGNSFSGTRTLTGMDCVYGVTGSAANFDLRFSFYRPSDVAFTGFSGPGTSMIAPGAIPYYVFTVSNLGPSCPGFTTRFGYIPFSSPFEVPTGDTGLMLDAAILEPGTPGTAPLTSTNLFQLNKTSTRVYFVFGSASGAVGPSFTGPQTAESLMPASNPARVGYTSALYGRDVNFDAVFTGSATASTSGTNELRYSGGAIQAGTQRMLGLAVGLVGAIPSPPAVAATSLNSGSGFLADGVSGVSGSLTTADKFKWYKFNTKFDIDYAQTTFMDIDTEGSQVPTAFALYTPDSNIFNISEGRGDGPDSSRPSDLDNHQMSFGVARRPGVGAGQQYSGQQGNLPAGEYYLAVALAGSGFGDGWNVLPTDPVTPKAFSINFNNNNQKTIAAPPAVSPSLDGGADLGILLGGSQATPEISVRARTVEFVRFSLTNPLPTTGMLNQSDESPLSDVTFMDITQPGSSVVGEWNFALYNNNGFLANGTSISYSGTGYNGNQGGGDGPYGCGGTFAQLSYGTAPSRGQTPLDPDQNTLGQPLNNQNGSTLNGDQYYMAVSLGDAYFANERWGARSTRGSSLAAVITVTSNNRGPSAGCPADFNGDGGVDDSDFNFFAKYYNDLINAAGDIDGSTDGLTDDSDFGAFVTAYDALVCF